MVVGSISYISDVQTDNYNFLNPAPPPTLVPLTLTYPDNTRPVCVQVSIQLKDDGILAANTSVRAYTAHAEVFNDCLNVAFVYVRISGAVYANVKWSNETGLVSNFPEVVLFVGPAVNRVLTASIVSGDTIVFPVAGEYSPTLSIFFENNTGVDHTYSEYKIPVASFVDIQNAKNARIQTALTYIIILFVFVEAFSTMIDLTKGKEAQSALNPPPIAVTTAPPQTSQSPNS
ncbi:MAG: hypothetical protein HY296_02835 [Thaumarchaeota archaeon]|nr:hypothetical protein [Nitrososphaerota archaeon]